MDKIIIYSTKHCSDCLRTKKWLSDHDLSYEEIIIDESDELIDHVLQLTHGDTRTPVLVLPDRRTLIEPTNDELAKSFSSS